MKTKNYFFVLFFLCSIFTKSQTSPIEIYDNNLQNIFANLEKDRIPTGLLLDAGVEFTNLKKFNGTLPDSSYTSARVITDIYKTLQLSRLSTAASFSKTVDEFITDWKTAQQIDIIPLAGVLYNYATFSDATVI